MTVGMEYTGNPLYSINEWPYPAGLQGYTETWPVAINGKECDFTKCVRAYNKLFSKGFTGQATQYVLAYSVIGPNSNTHAARLIEICGGLGAFPARCDWRTRGVRFQRAATRTAVGETALKNRTLLTWAIAVAVVTVIGIGWEIAALQVFADRAGGMRGMIANPRPPDYVNYDYTPKGHHYAFWAFTMPLTMTGSLLLIAGIAGTVMFVRSGVRKRAIALWAFIVVCALVVFVVTAYYYLIATNFFI